MRFLLDGNKLKWVSSADFKASSAATSPMMTWYVLRRSGSRPNPTPLEALDWGSQSTSSVGAPRWANDAAKLIAVVVFPTPPFWLATAMILDMAGNLSRLAD